VADVAESVIFVKYNKTANTLVVFADDSIPRWVTSMCNLDYDTVAAADKFGNIFVSRLPADIKDDVSSCLALAQAYSMHFLNPHLSTRVRFVAGAHGRLQILAIMLTDLCDCWGWAHVVGGWCGRRSGQWWTVGCVQDRRNYSVSRW